LIDKEFVYHFFLIEIQIKNKTNNLAGLPCYKKRVYVGDVSRGMWVQVRPPTIKQHIEGNLTITFAVWVLSRESKPNKREGTNE